MCSCLEAIIILSFFETWGWGKHVAATTSWIAIGPMYIDHFFASVRSSAQYFCLKRETNKMYKFFSLSSVLIDIILLIVVAATAGWVKAGLLQVGLFKYCIDELCGTTLTLLLSTSNATVSACKASQAFVVLAILLDSLFVAIVVLRIVATSKDYEGIAALMAKLPDATEPVLAALIAVSVTIVWAAGLSLRFDICDLVGEEQSCEVHYSFIITMIVWFSALTVLYGAYQEYCAKQQILRNAATAVRNLEAAAHGPEQVNVYQAAPQFVIVPSANAWNANQNVSDAR
jgi:hypothetical protein